MDDNRPVWRFGLVDWDGPFGWSRLDPAAVRDVHQKLTSYEGQRWGEIKGSRNNHCGSMEIDKLSPEARARLEEIRLDDTAHLFKLNCGGPARIWGIADRNMLQILWWDPEHKVYPTEKKHT